MPISIPIPIYPYAQVWAILDEFLHSDVASRQDNYRKRKVILTLPPNPDTGEAEYCVHWQRELRRNWKSLFVLLTGMDTLGSPVAGLGPTSWWKKIQRITKTDKRPGGIIGSPKMLSKHACPCLAAACISQCSCPHCTTFLENLDHRHLATTSGWRRTTAVCVVVPASGATSADGHPCDKCGGACQDPNGPWKKMSAGLLPFLSTLLCPPVELPNVRIAAVDPNTGLEIPGESLPVKIIPRKCWLGECADCGWDKVFASFPLLPLTLEEDSTTSREVFVRACPREARLDAHTTYHEFRKMERGSCVDGKPYVQPEWTPVTCTRRMFYYQLVEFMRDFLPHYYKVGDMCACSYALLVFDVCMCACMLCMWCVCMWRVHVVCACGVCMWCTQCPYVVRLTCVFVCMCVTLGDLARKISRGLHATLQASSLCRAPHPATTTPLHGGYSYPP